MSDSTISSISYDASSGVLTVTGSNLGGSIVSSDLTLYGNGSLTLSKSDIIGNLTATGFTVTLSSADRVKAGAIFPENGSNASSKTFVNGGSNTSTTVSNYAYELYAAAGWNGSGSLPAYYTGPLAVSGAGTLSANHYNTSLSFNDDQRGTLFARLKLSDSDAGDRVSATLTLPAANGTLHGTGLSAGTLSGTTESYTLAATTASQLARELRTVTLTPALHEVAGGNSVSNPLTLTVTGSNSSLNVVNITQTETIHSTAPGVTKVSYDAAHGILNVSGMHLSKNLALGDFSVTAGGNSYTLSGSGDSITKFSAHGFTLQLDSSDQAGVNAVFTGNGSGSKTAAYTLALTGGWDGGGNPADTAGVTASYVTLSLKGAGGKIGLTDMQTIQPFRHIVVSDSGGSGVQDTATLSFSAANGTLSGTGLSAATVSGGTASYTLAAASPATLQQELRELTFTPTAQQTTVGKTVTTTLTLNVSSSANSYGNSAALDSLNSQTTLEAHGSAAAAAITGVSYNAYSGVLTVTGTDIGNSLALDKLTLSNGSGSYTLGGGDQVTKVGKTGFSVQLGGSSQSAANALFPNNGDPGGKYVLTAAAGWDGSRTQADNDTVSVTRGSVTLSGGSQTYSIADNASVKPFATVDVSGGTSGGTLSANIGYTAADGSMTGAGLSGSAGNYTLTASSAAALQQALQQLVFTPTRYLTDAGSTVTAPVTLTVSGTTSALDSTSMLESIVIKATAAPTIDSVAYNAQTGVLTVSGSNLNGGVVPAGLTLSAGGQTYTLGSGDTLGAASATSFSVTLSSAGKTAVAAMFTSDGTGNGNGDSFILATAANWDGAGTTASSGTAVYVSGVNSIAAGGLTTSSIADSTLVHPFGNLTLSDGNVTESDGVSISFTAGNGTLSGSGLSSGTVANGTISYTLAAATAQTLQTELAGLLFTPAAGLSATTTFDLNFTGSTYTLANTPSQTVHGGMRYPTAVTTDGNGDVFVANNGSGFGKAGAGFVDEYAADGKLLRVLKAGVSQPSSLTTDSQGNVYVGNYATDQYGHGTVQEYAADGALLRTFTGMTDVQSVAVDGNGDLFVACLAGNINKGNGYVAEFASDGTLLRVLSSGVNQPRSVTTDNAGNVFVASYGSNSVQEFSAGGKLLQTLSDGAGSPLSLATDNAGNVAVAYYDQSTSAYYVDVYAADGTLLHTLNNHFGNVSCVATDSHDNVFVADSSNNTISEFSTDGLLLATLRTGLANPVNLHVDSQGNLFVANQTGNSVEEFSPVMNGGLPTVSYSASVTLSATAGATSLTLAPNASVASLTVVQNAAAGMQLTLADAESFSGSQITTAMVTAAGDDATQLAGWVAAALDTAGGDLAQHGIAWFQFGGNTYLLEQANTGGSAYASGDTLIELTGMHDESAAGFNAAGHVLTLV